ncbi:hypothetical protein VTO42DRAFT_1819 [Malbranchea cinnamomea]
MGVSQGTSTALADSRVLHSNEISVAQNGSSDDSEHKGSVAEEEIIESATRAAEKGQAATDKYGRSLVKFDPEAEKKLCRKIDLFIVPTVSLLYMFCFIDRANVGNARIAGFDKDLNMQGYDYNLTLTAFYISYTVFEIPCVMLCKLIGPGWFIPATTLLFGVSSLGTAFVNTVPAACGVRFVLGFFEAGMLPGIAYYMSRWYRRSELTFRLSLYIAMAPIAGAFGGLLASGILKLERFGSLTTWRMIFGIEGIITIGLGVLAFFTLTDRPETARWLTEEEKALAVARIKSERVSTTEILDKVDRRKLLRGIFCPVTSFTSFIFLLDNVTVQGMGFFLPTIIRAIYPDRSVITQQLYTVPPYAVGTFFTVFIPYLSWKFDRRVIFMIGSAPLTMVGYIMYLASSNQQVRYAASFLVASGAFSYGALTSSNVSANVVSDTARSAAISTNAMWGCVGGIVSTWSYLPFDGPDFKIGNGLNLGTSTGMLIGSIAMSMWMMWDNKKRDKRDVDAELAGLEQWEIQDLDWKHPGFRWKM